MPLAVLRAGTRYEVRGPMTAVLWASGVVQGVGLAKTLRGRSAALSRELADLELLAEPRWRVSRRRWRPNSVCRRRSSPSPLEGALQIDCAKGTKQLRGRGHRCGISALGSGGCAAGRGYGESRGAAGARKVCVDAEAPSPLRGALQIDCANGTKQLRGRGNRCGISALGSGGCAAGRG